MQTWTIQTICDDHRKFVAAGSRLKKVKEFNNCPFSPTSLSQVCYENRLKILSSYRFLVGVPTWELLCLELLEEI
jgi:hypothetical protein